VALDEELRRIAERAVRFCAEGEELAGIVPAEPGSGDRLYLCAYRGEREETAWLVLDAEGKPVGMRALVRDAVSIAGLCELAEEVAGGGGLDELRARLGELRETENPPGIDEAERAVDGLEATIGGAGALRVATPAHLDAVGSATRELEQALGEGPGSPFVEAMKQATGTIDELLRDVERGYKVPLS
jgi:hypothetical protein